MKARLAVILAVLAVLAALTSGPAAGGEKKREEAGGAEPRREAVHRKADLLTGRTADEPAWKKAMRKQLQRKVSFEFVDTPLSEAINFLQTLTKINIILDPRAAKGGANTPITLKVSNMSLGLALEWILKLAELDYTFKHQAIFITKPENVGRAEAVLKIYDVRDLTAAVTDFPAPEVGPAGRIGARPSSTAATALQATPLTEMIKARQRPDMIAEMLQTRVKPDTCAVELGTSIEEREGRLVVLQTPEVHALIAKLLDIFRAGARFQIRVEARFVAVSEELLAKLRAREKPGAGVIFMKAAQMKMLAKALAADEEAAKLVDSAALTCFNTQRAHVMSGRSFERRAGDGKLEGVYFRGTVLDVRPTVSFDRQYVTMELRLTRAAQTGDDPEAPPQYFKTRTTTTCLETDTVLITGASVPGTGGKTRLVALVTPTILRLEPAPPKAKVAAPAKPMHGLGAALGAGINEKLKKRVSIELVNTPVREAAAMLQKIGGVPIVFAKGVDLKGNRGVTLKMKEVELSLALSWLTRANDLRWVVHDNKVIIMAPEPKDPRRLHKAPVRRPDDEEKEVF